MVFGLSNGGWREFIVSFMVKLDLSAKWGACSFGVAHVASKEGLAEDTLCMTLCN